jgi:glycosyltransferase involved in cell wall biosynthesis
LLHAGTLFHQTTYSRVWTAIAWVAALAWVCRATEASIFLRRVPDLTQLPLSSPLAAPGVGPVLSVIVPACNEQGAIEATIRSLLASTGVPLEVIAVDDRSTDATGAILDRLAQEFAAPGANPGTAGNTLSVLHVQTLPQGWLGKPHALAQGVALARAPHLLFTDADILFRDDAILRSLSYLRRENLDHLALLATAITHTPGERVVLGALSVLAAWSIRLWRVQDPKARESLGVGSFTLVSREAYEQVGGWAAVRTEVLEDLRFGWELKRHHRLRQAVALGSGLLQLHWAPGAIGLAHNLGKNGFAVFRYRLAVALGAVAGMLVLLFAPIVALVGPPAARWAFLPFAVSVWVLHRLSRRQSDIRARYLWLFPIGGALLLYGVLRSVVLTLARGGVVWRGTLYPLAWLRSHAGPLR